MVSSKCKEIVSKFGYIGFGAIIPIVGQLVLDNRKELDLNNRKKENESFQNTREFKVGVVAGKLTETGQNIYRGGNPYVKNPQLSHSLKSFTDPSKLGGLRILYGPQGSGKSTHIREYISELISEGGHGIVLTGTSSMEDLRRELHVPIHGELSDYVPKGTLIVIDQVENIKIDNDTDRFFRSLATESRNRNMFRAVVCVSEPDTSLRLLELNGKEKIKDLCSSDVLKWGELEIDEFIDQRFPHMASVEKKFLRGLAIHASLPGFLVSVADEHGVTTIPGDERRKKELTKRALGYNEAWVKFKKIDEGIEYFTHFIGRNCSFSGQ